MENIKCILMKDYILFMYVFVLFVNVYGIIVIGFFEVKIIIYMLN